MAPPTRTRRRLRRSSFTLGDLDVKAGRSAVGDLPISRLVTGTRISLPVNVLHGRLDGPVVWLSAAVHGDEIAGVEIIRRALASIDPRSLSGTIVAVPIVNVHGFLNGDRYLPDRRDLNRSFPGSPGGSLAARVANLFMNEIVARCEVGIDLHTGSDHRINMPHVRADLDDPTTRELAIAFGTPLMMHAKVRDGSLRAAATASGSTVLLYEGGEAWRFDRAAIEAGYRGVRRVLAQLDMTDDDTTVDGAAPPVPVESRSSSWVRARRSGIALIDVELGQEVERGQTVAVVRDSVGRRLSTTKAPRSGIVIAHIQQPLVNQGDALIHIAEISSPGSSATAPSEQHSAAARLRDAGPEYVGTAPPESAPPESASYVSARSVSASSVSASSVSARPGPAPHESAPPVPAPPETMWTASAPSASVLPAPIPPDPAPEAP